MDYVACGRHHALGYRYDQKKKKSKNIKSRIFRTNILVGKTCDHKTKKRQSTVNDACPEEKNKLRKGVARVKMTVKENFE